MNGHAKLKRPCSIVLLVDINTLLAILALLHLGNDSLKFCFTSLRLLERHNRVTSDKKTQTNLKNCLGSKHNVIPIVSKRCLSK